MELSMLLGTGGVILALIAAFFVLVAIVSRYYKKVPPNSVAVITGRTHKVKVRDANGAEQTIERGFRYVSGGGFFLVPIVEEMEKMSLTVIPVNVSVKDVPDKNGALVNVEGIANIKVMSTNDLLPLAIERFLGKSPEEIKNTCFMTLEGNLRGVIGTLTIEELLREREKFQQAVMNEAGLDLNKMGIGVDTFKIQSITDSRKYIESLGLKQTAEVVKNATVGQAEAKRDSDKMSAEARRIGETAQAESLKAISDANRDRDTTIADNEARVKAQQAQIPIAAQIAAANRTKELNTATVEAEKATITAGIALQEEEQKRHQAELDATIIVKANKDREALVIAADAKAKAAERDGEAERILKEKQGLAQQAKDTGDAVGRKAIASAVQAEMEAKAAGDKATLLAHAAGKEADLLAAAAGTKAEKLAIAEGLRQYLLAEAEGALKKAEAFKALDEGGRFLMILNALPPIIEALGVAAEKALTPAAEAIGDGLANVKELRIIDMGGSSAGTAGGKNVLGQFANLPVETIYGLVNKLKASGMMPVVEGLAKKYGFDLGKMLESLPANVPAVASASDVAAPAVGASAESKN
ncbi:MAG: SPFH domain-containing protein [bacterium]|nr:SPFH domain-containing protein [bacterium]